MRTLILVSLIFLFAPVAHAECVEDQFAGTYYDSKTGDSCTPRSGVDTSTTKRTGVDTTPTGQDVKLINPLKGGGNLMSFLQSILDFVIKIGTVVVILMMVFVGYKFVVAQGAPDKIKEARDALLWTLIGALILLGSKAIAFGIEKTVQAISVGG